MTEQQQGDEPWNDPASMLPVNCGPAADPQLSTSDLNVEELLAPLPEGARFEAYYFGFEPTGIGPVDAILSAVAVAGKGSHHTESWGESRDFYSNRLGLVSGESAADLIQTNADHSAAIIRSLASELAASRQRAADAEAIIERAENDTLRALLAAALERSHMIISAEHLEEYLTGLNSTGVDHVALVTDGALWLAYCTDPDGEWFFESGDPLDRFARDPGDDVDQDAYYHRVGFDLLGPIIDSHGCEILTPRPTSAGYLDIVEIHVPNEGPQ